MIAVIADDMNNAPALKEADFGPFIGIQDTEVAKESSGIVLMDDNFTSCSTILRWGTREGVYIIKF